MQQSNIDLDILHGIEDLLKKNLNGKDRDVVTSFHQYYSKNGKLSERQQSYLSNIIERYSENTDEWKASFDDEKRERFKQAVHYYFNTPYFSEVVRLYNLDNNFIPSRRQYEKMCENKYFIRAIENYKIPPKYSIGDMVCWRDSIYRGTNKSIGLVDSVSEVPSYHAGRRKYTILWLEDGQRTETIENRIKLYREPKKKATTPSDTV